MSRLKQIILCVNRNIFNPVNCSRHKDISLRYLVSVSGSLPSWFVLYIVFSDRQLPLFRPCQTNMTNAVKQVLTCCLLCFYFKHRAVVFHKQACAIGITNNHIAGHENSNNLLSSVAWKI